MEQKKWGLSGGTLKIIALVTMIIDHFFAIFVDSATQHNIYTLGRGIGRLAFPIYCFLLVQGFIYTKNRMNYAIRLFLFALLSEVPFDYAFLGTPFYPGHQNVFFTLLLGFLFLCFNEWCGRYSGKLNDLKVVLFTLLAYVFFYFIAMIGHTDYQGEGVLLIWIFYLFRNDKMKTAIGNAGMNFLMGMGGGVQAYGALASIPISLYNGKKGISLKYFFYIIYPLHLLIFALVKYRVL